MNAEQEKILKMVNDFEDIILRLNLIGSSSIQKEYHEKRNALLDWMYEAEKISSGFKKLLEDVKKS